MNKHRLFLIVFAALWCFASAAYGKELIKEFKGSSSKSTAEFEVTAPWILDWRVTGEFHEGLGLQVSLINSGTGEYIGKAVSTKWIGNGVRLFNESGRFHFKVDSTFAKWTLKVEKLSRQEAEAYTEKKPYD